VVAGAPVATQTFFTKVHTRLLSDPRVSCVSEPSADGKPVKLYVPKGAAGSPALVFRGGGAAASDAAPPPRPRLTADRGASRTNAAPATPQQRREPPPPYTPPASHGVTSAPLPMTNEEIESILPAFWR
jgi:hypothetical protein